MLIVVQTTCATQDSARAIAQAAVTANLCACAHIDEIESVYRWQGQICTGAEWRLSLKTVQGRFDVLAALIRKMHSYELPAIHAVAVSDVTPDYAAWVKENSGC